MILEQFYKNSELRHELILCKPNKEPLYNLYKAENVGYSVQLAKMGQLSFDYPYDENDIIWSKLKGDYLIYYRAYDDEVTRYENYYIASNISDIDEESTKKTINCNSADFQIGNKRLTSFSGVKKIYRTSAEIATYTSSETYPTLQSFVESGILNYVIEQLNPQYSIGFIDSDLNSKFRFIDIDDTNCYEFLLSTLQNIFECVCIFDNINNTISIKKFENIGYDRGVSINNQNYLKKIENNVEFEDVYTVLYLYGKDDLTINGINITGSNALVNLNYYKNREYMSQELIDALNNYETLLTEKEGDFTNLLSQLNTIDGNILTENQNLTTLNIELKELQEQRYTLIYSDVKDLTAIDSQISAKESEIASIQNTIDNLNNNRSGISSQISNLRATLSLENNFTPQLIKERSYFIKETSVVNSAFFDAEELKSFGENLLNRISTPSYEISIDSEDFFSNFEGKDRDRITLGDIINIYDDKINLNVQLRLVGYSYDIQNRQLTLSFTNKNNINDKTTQISDLLKNSQTSSRSLDLNKFKYSDYYQNDKNNINNYITEELDLAAQGARSGIDNNITLDFFGLTATNTIDSNKKVRVASDGMIITEDNFQTAKLAINSKGVFADVIFGRLLAGTNLQIETDDGTVSIDNEGFRVRDIDLEILSSTGNNKTIINATDGFKLQKKNGSVFDDLITTDSLGNLDLKGFLTVGEGNSIFKASDKGIHLGNAIFENAPFSVSLLGQLKATNADIDGIIRCKELYINGISTNAISNNKIKGEFLDGENIVINTNPYMITVNDKINTNSTAISENSTSITQNAQQIELKVDADNIVNSINLDSSGITIDANKINLVGVTNMDGLVNISNTINLGAPYTIGAVINFNQYSSISSYQDYGLPKLRIFAGQQLTVNAVDGSYFNGRVYSAGNELSTQAWVSQNFQPLGSGINAVGNYGYGYMQLGYTFDGSNYYLQVYLDGIYKGKIFIGA